MINKKSKNIAVISGTAMLCAILVGVIAAQFTKDGIETDYVNAETMPPEINVSITTTTYKNSITPEIVTKAVTNENGETIIVTRPADNGTDSTKPAGTDTTRPADIENGGNETTDTTEDDNGGGNNTAGSDKTAEEERKPATTTAPPTRVVNQDFEIATKPTTPPPPTLKDEAALTNMDEEPVYEEEQTVVTTAVPEGQPKNGQVSGDQIYVQGFGWIDYEGGGGIGEVNEQMYQNGNKIGYFG